MGAKNAAPWRPMYLVGLAARAQELETRLAALAAALDEIEAMLSQDGSPNMRSACFGQAMGERYLGRGIQRIINKHKAVGLSDALIKALYPQEPK